MIKDTILEEKTSSILSDMHEGFVASSTKIPPHIDTTGPTIPGIFKNFEYPVSSWPVIIDAHMAKRFKEISAKIPELIKRIPSLYFKDATQRLADFYFGGNQMIAEFALMSHKKAVEVSCRLDLVETHNGPKVLEANIGSAIGGWQLCSFLQVIRDHHPNLVQLENAGALYFENTQQQYLSFLVDKIFQYVPGVNTEVNIFVSIGKVSENVYASGVIQFLDSLMQLTLTERGLTGRIYYGESSSLQLTGSELFLEGKRIHGVLKMDEEQLPAEVFRSFIMDGVYLPDNLGTLMYSDKRNLSLLIELAQQGKFSEEENELVLNSIPWTSIVEEKQILFKGQEYSMFSFLELHKDELVIKVANGLQGIDVYVGKFLSREQWTTAIEKASGHHPYVAQEFSDSLNFISPDGLDQWQPHKIIWGAFGFGDRYGGTFVRMSAIKTDVGVINAATGAVEALVYEQKE